MAVIQFARQEIEARILVVGPAGSGKGTLVARAAERLGSDDRAERRLGEVELAAASVTFGEVAGYTMRYLLLTAPPGRRHQEVRQRLVPEADGLVLVLDPRPHGRSHNAATIGEVRRLLRDAGRDPAAVPTVFLFNKQDLPGRIELQRLREELGLEPGRVVTGSLRRSEGVQETLENVSQQVVRHVREALAGRQSAIALDADNALDPTGPAALLDALVQAADSGAADGSLPPDEDSASELHAFLASYVERPEPSEPSPPPASPEPGRPARETPSPTPDLPPGPVVRLPFLHPSLAGYRAIRVLDAQVGADGGVQVEAVLAPPGGGTRSRTRIVLAPEVPQRQPARAGPSEPARTGGGEAWTFRILAAAVLLAVAALSFAGGWAARATWAP